jgi:hypothetical protein
MQRRSEVSKMLARLLIAAAQMLLLPLARLSDKLVWSKVRHGLGGKVYTCLHTMFWCLVSGGGTLKTKAKKGQVPSVGGKQAAAVPRRLLRNGRYSVYLLY